MTYHIMTWAAVAWIAVWLTTYLYAVNDLITWPSSLKGLEILSSQITRGRCIGEIKMPSPMKLYNHALAPNPRRVRIFAAEKDIELRLADIDILAGQSRTPEFLTIANRRCARQNASA